MRRKVGAPNNTPKKAVISAEIGSISQNDTVKMDRARSTRRWRCWTRPSHWNGSQNAPPFRLHLIGGEIAVSIGADGEEGRVAEIEQPGEADDDIEAERQDRVGERIRGRIDIALVAVDQREQDAKHEESDDEAAASDRALGAIPDGRNEARSAPHGRVVRPSRKAGAAVLA